MNVVSHRATPPFLIALLLTFVAAPAAPAQNIVAGHVDTFQDGTTQGWSTGLGDPTPPTNQSGGPGGASDLYLQFQSSGTIGAGSRLIVFNSGSNWTGNYFSAGITGIDMDLKNFNSSGGATLHMRIALMNGTSRFSSGYESTTSFDIAPGSVWLHHVFPIDAANLTPVNSPPALNTFLTNVLEVRLLSAQSVLDFQGDTIAATAGADNIRALPVPEPGSVLLVAAAAGLAGGAAVRVRRWARFNGRPAE